MSEEKSLYDCISETNEAHLKKAEAIFDKLDSLIYDIQNELPMTRNRLVERLDEIRMELY